MRCSVALALVACLLGCDRSSSKPTTDPVDNSAEPAKSEPKEKDNDKEKAAKPAKSRLNAHKSVERHETSQGWGLPKQDVLGKYEVRFPEAPEFKDTETDEYTRHAASKVFKGTIWRIDVSDYSKSKSKKSKSKNEGEHKEHGFLVFEAKKFVEHFEGKLVEESDVVLPDGRKGHYVTFSYELDGKLYLTDRLSFRAGDDIIALSTVSRPKYEGAPRVEEFFNSFTMK